MQTTALDFDAFRTAVEASGIALDVRTDDVARFRGRFRALSGGDVHVLRLSAATRTVTRTPGLIARAPRGSLKLTLVERGSVIVVQDGREALVQAGEMAVYDTERPYSRSIASIATDAGFVDSAHFSRAFRAHFGCPPSAVRAGARPTGHVAA